MNALEILRSLPGPKETRAMLPRGDRRVIIPQASALYYLKLIEAESHADFVVFRRTALGQWLLKMIEEEKHE